jgi:uncharacterized protein YcgL (UPF0745 family)
LYIAKRDDFSKVPKKLLETFGNPVFVMIINFDKHQKLALANRDKVIEQVTQNGFYLQIPPPQENLLEQHVKANKRKANDAQEGIDE